MPVFHYKGLAANGAVAEGKVEAGGRQEAFRLVEAKGLRPIRLAEGPGATGRNGKPAPAKAGNGAAAEAAPAFSLALGGARKISARVLENFTRLLSSLLAAGIPLSRALVILCKESASPAAGEKWKELYNRVVDGMSLADAMAKSPDTFPRVYVAMVEAGETGGFLDVVLAQIADFQAREKEMRSKVMTALLYPTILLVLALAVLIFLLVFFIPRFQAIFTGFGATLPLLTQLIVGVSRLLRRPLYRPRMPRRWLNPRPLNRISKKNLLGRGQSWI